jgi:hypothetical protein
MANGTANRLRGMAIAAVAAGMAAVAPVASAARVLPVRDEGSLRYVSSEASSILDEGALHGSLPGRGRVVFVYNGSPTVSARFTIHAAGGTISGNARCRLHNPTSLTPSFRGALAVTGGSGRYAHARGSGELFGVFHRRGYSLLVQAVGRMSY